MDVDVVVVVGGGVVPLSGAALEPLLLLLVLLEPASLPASACTNVGSSKQLAATNPKLPIQHVAARRNPGALPDILSANGVRCAAKNGVRFLFPAAICASVLPIAVACTDTSADIDVTGPQPQIVAAVGPPNGVVACNDPVLTTDAGAIVDAGENLGGSCPIAVTITFHLPQGQFVNKALVRFQGDGSSDGIDRGFVLAPDASGKATPRT